MYDHSQLSLFAFIILISSSGNLRSFRELISGGGGGIFPYLSLFPGNARNEARCGVRSHIESKGLASCHLYIQISVIADSEINGRTSRIRLRLESNMSVCNLIKNMR